MGANTRTLRSVWTRWAIALCLFLLGSEQFQFANGAGSAFAETATTVGQLLSTQGQLQQGVLAIVPDASSGAGGAITLPPATGASLTLTGKGGAVPPGLLNSSFPAASVPPFTALTWGRLADQLDLQGPALALTTGG